MSVDWPWGFPKPLRSLSADPIRIRFWKTQRPTRVSVSAWRLRGEDGDVAGPREPVEFTLQPYVRRGRTVAWDAVFGPILSSPFVIPFGPLVVGDYYVGTTAGWRDRECGPRDREMQRIQAWFHLSSGM